MEIALCTYTVYYLIQYSMCIVRMSYQVVPGGDTVDATVFFEDGECLAEIAEIQM